MNTESKVINQGRNLKNLITNFLRNNRYVRDNDMKLYANVVWFYCCDKDIDLEKISGMEFLKIMAKHEGFPMFESVRRTRQKIQEQNPELRGELYVKRHNLKSVVREEIKTL